MPAFEASHIERDTPLRRGRLWRAFLVAGLLAGGVASLWLAHAQSATPFVDQPVGWVTRPLLSSNNLSSGTEVIYNPGYDGAFGTGELKANEIDTDGIPKGNSPWDNQNAADTLDGQDFNTGRNIVTFKSDGNRIGFRWDQLSATQQASIGDATSGPKILNYVRGNRSDEGPDATDLRVRRTVLGPIVQSSLLRWDHGSGIKRLYVGANDGMLHAFDAATGREVFAYVPSLLIPRLKDMAGKSYQPQRYVDGPMSMASVLLGTQTRPMLVGGLGAGGRGLFALDFSNPNITNETTAAAALKWEVTASSAGMGNLGYTYSMPRLTRLNNGTAAVVVGNGYGNSGNFQASLYVLNAETGAVIREIGTGSGSSTTPNGLSSPALLDTDGDGRVDVAYAGDLLGQLWKFNLKPADPSAYTATLLFTTTPAQAITTVPAVKLHPNGGHMVVFGTGKALVKADLSDPAAHAVYGIWDGAPAVNTTLVNQTVSSAISLSGELWRSTSQNQPNWNATTAGPPAVVGHRGWRLALPAGERVMGEAPFISDDKFLFTAMNPTSPSGTVSGVAHGPGINWLVEVDYLSGGNVTDSIFDINRDGVINASDKYAGTVLNSRFVSYGVASQPVLTDLPVLSRTLFNSNPDVSLTIATTGGGTTTTSTDRGVSGGHFDVDLYYSGTNKRHVHEYDDKYNVTGVNFLAPSDPGFNLKLAIPSTTTTFKVLAINQYLNPASQIKLGTGSYENVKTFQGQASAVDAAFVNALPVYSRSTVSNFVWKLPIDAFQSKDWWGDGGPLRAGLIPTQTGCVNKGPYSTTGLNGEIYNGSLTLQLIKPATPASALELNYPTGGAKYGWRVKSALRSTYVLAEYTLFWHHPNGRCYGQASWVPNPPQDFSTDSKTLIPAVGAADPDKSAAELVSSTATTVGNVTTIVDVYSDGSTRTTVITSDSSTGTETVQVTNPDGSISTVTRLTSSTVIGEKQLIDPTGRFNWREVSRP